MLKNAKLLFEHCHKSLKEAGLDEANALSYRLLEDGFGISKIDIVLEKPCDPDPRLESLLSRLRSHEPIQQVLGFTFFLSRKFLVDSNVLVPRPETEELITHALALNLQKPKVIDIGTGSGCIAISLAKILPQATLTAIDISAKALALAQKNAANHSVDVEFLCIDILKEQDKIPKDFDLIVSNPPYIQEHEKTEMQRNVLDFEPHIALFVPDENPLLFYKALAEFGLQQTKGLYIIAEINSKLGEETKAIFENCGYIEVEILQDFFGKDRFVRARKA